MERRLTPESIRYDTSGIFQHYQEILFIRKKRRENVTDVIITLLVLARPAAADGRFNFKLDID